jgi:peptidyl-prolyl cis-trans isomerase SurA
VEEMKCNLKLFGENIFQIIKKLQILLILILISFNAHTLENKIILKIDNDIITSMDILEEINNLKFFNQNLRDINKEEIYQIGLNSLINYKIKKQEVLKYFNKIEIENEDYIKSIIENNAKKLNFKNILDFKKVLNEKNINYENYEEKIKVNILWNQIIYSKYNNQLDVNEIELKEKIKGQNDNKKTFNLSEIVFQIENLDDLKITYETIKSDISKLGFENAVLKYSVSNTSNEGGDLGWVDETLINNKILEQLKAMSIGSITNPIRIPSGFLILKVKDVKKIEKDLDIDQEVKKLINYEKEKQLNNYASIYFKKIKNNIKINAP